MHILIKVTNALKGKSAPTAAKKFQEVFYLRLFFCTSLHYESQWWSFSYADFKQTKEGKKQSRHVRQPLTSDMNTVDQKLTNIQVVGNNGLLIIKVNLHTMQCSLMISEKILGKKLPKTWISRSFRLQFSIMQKNTRDSRVFLPKPG